MKADGRCDKCGAYVAKGHGVVVGDRLFHTSCNPTPPVRRKTGYEGTRPIETGSPFKYEHLDEKPSAD